MIHAIPNDKGNYLDNVASTVKRIRNHPSLAYYVASNESTEVTGTPELLNKLDGTRGYQMQSECAGVHDGSPYKQVNPMQHYEIRHLHVEAVSMVSIRSMVRLHFPQWRFFVR